MSFLKKHIYIYTYLYTCTHAHTYIKIRPKVVGKSTLKISNTKQNKISACFTYIIVSFQKKKKIGAKGVKVLSSTYCSLNFPSVCYRITTAPTKKLKEVKTEVRILCFRRLRIIIPDL